MALKFVFAKHHEWVEMVKRFGCNQETAEDIVQDMYVKIHLKVEQGTDIMFSKSEVNYYYIFKTLNNLFLDLKRKEKRYHLECIEDHQIEIEEQIDYEQIYEKVEEELDKFHWYDQMVYGIIQNGQSISALHRKSKISYYSLYNTYRKVKSHLLKQIK